MDNANTPDLGVGPWSVEHDPDNGFYWLTIVGVRQGNGYPLGKTAYRECRKRNTAVNLGPKPDKLPTLPAGEPETADNYPAVSPKPARPKRQPKVKHGAAADPTPTASFQGTREEWLNAFVAAARPVFAGAGSDLPPKIRVSVGFTGARGGRKVLGACWHEEASYDGTREIFVVPTLDDSALIAGVLTHELCHTLFGPDEKHGKNFKAAGAAVGLVGKATSMLPPQDGEKNKWHAWADPILADLGPIPHAKLDPTKSGVKKQSTRLLKATCDTCGFNFRLTAKWVSGRTLRCPDEECEGFVSVEVPSESEGE